jgi:hypothetical protein
VMAYVHVRCGHRNDQPTESLLEGLAANVRERAVESLMFVTTNQGDRMDVVVCPKGHVMRVRIDASGARLRCRCGWRHEYWRSPPDEAEERVQPAPTSR